MSAGLHSKHWLEVLVELFGHVRQQLTPTCLLLKRNKFMIEFPAFA